MADRRAAVEGLQRGLPYREIHRLTGVSVTTIGRVARFLAARQRRLCAGSAAPRRQHSRVEPVTPWMSCA